MAEEQPASQLNRRSLQPGTTERQPVLARARAHVEAQQEQLRAGGWSPPSG
jgi:hypothetical protein